MKDKKPRPLLFSRFADLAMFNLYVNTSCKILHSQKGHLIYYYCFFQHNKWNIYAP